jgi:peptide/nickel transport system permease protein
LPTVHLILKRFAQLVLLLLLLTAATTLLSSLIPGDFFATQELDPTISRETIQQLRRQHGLDQPALTQYAGWLRNMLRLDLGYSLFYRAPVADVLLSALRKTLWIAIPALLIGTIGGVLLGTLHATWNGRPAGFILDVLSTVILSLPSLLLGLGAILIAARTGWFPIGSMNAPTLEATSAHAWLIDRLHHLILPVLCLSIPVFATIERIQHTAARGALDQAYVRSARARGLHAWRVFARHLLRPSLNAVISTSGPLFGAVLSGSLVLEVIFSWPGLGRITYDALFSRDVSLLLGSVVASGVLLVFANLAADIALWRLDPRTRSVGGGVMR